MSMDSLAGGMPCKHLEWEEVSPIKIASAGEPPSVDLEIAQAVARLLESV